MHIRNVGQQADYFLPAANNAELVRLLDRIDRIATGICEPDYLGFRGLRLKKERGKIRRVLRMPDGAEHRAAIRFDDRRCVPLQGVAKRIIGSDEEPALTPLLDHRLPRRLGESISIIGPVHAGRRARFARKIRRAGR